MEIYIILSAIVVVVAFVVGYMLGRKSPDKQMQEAMHQLATERDVAINNAKNLRESYELQIGQLKEHSERMLSELREMNAKQVEAQLSMIREQMQATSESVLKERQKELGERNVEQLSKIVDPINLSLKLMREALDNTKKEHSDSMTRLDATIEANMRNSKELGETADRLTRALLGRVKVQGNFGELKLRQLLDDLGLEENAQYTTQQGLTDRAGRTLRSDDDRRLIPDFILHFPNKRDVIVDSKVSLVAYEKYVNAENEVEREIALKQHIDSVRDHVRSLASKDYSRYLDSEYTKLNFVFMYMFNEGALNLALLNDNTLWRDAYDMGVLIMGPQTMYMNLRVLELMWTQSRQLHYQEKIVKEAETMIKRVQLFAERFDAVEHSFQDTLKCFDSLKILTADKGTSIITSARQIISYGVKEEKRKRSLSSVYVEEEDNSMLGLKEDK
ncbi:MAG: DNA recombination protein RmuC [Alistipes sp.]|jgi:DNA recombination protein RmuC|nr:DNA recombination protein RmuC [Alistipes sp.]MBO7311250.1 DNA recombination protein RmuC [Alistipes sp.]